MAKLDDQKKLVDQVMKEFGQIDILFNNAGTNPYPGTLLDAEEWAWDTTMNVNLKGQFFLGQMVARIMKEKGGGNIINTASVAGLRASGLSIYCVTKAGLIMLTQCMAREWGQYGIRVNAIAPGVIETRLSAGFVEGPGGGSRGTQPYALRFPRTAGRCGRGPSFIWPQTHPVILTGITIVNRWWLHGRYAWFPGIAGQKKGLRCKAQGIRKD